MGDTMDYVVGLQAQPGSDMLANRKQKVCRALSPAQTSARTRVEVFRTRQVYLMVK